MARSSLKMGIKSWLLVASMGLGAVLVVGFRLSSYVRSVSTGLDEMFGHAAVRAGPDRMTPSDSNVAKASGGRALVNLTPTQVSRDVPPCVGRIRLYGSPPDSTPAALAHADGDEAKPVTIARAELDQLVVRLRGGLLCSVRFSGQWVASTEQPMLDASGASNDAPMPNAGGGISHSDFDQAIRRSDEGHYQLDADVIRRVLENGGDAITDVDLAPSGPATRLGTRTGFYEYLGLREGDLLLSANGEPVDTVDGLVQAFSSVGAKQSLLMKVRRGGRALAIHYAAQ